MAEGATSKVRRPARRKAPTTADPIEIAMEAAAKGGGQDEVAREVLRKQGVLIGWQIISERANAGLKVGAGVLALAVVAMLGVMVWSASRADGLVIRAFSVPPSLAQRGVTGEALAAQLMDRLGTMTVRSPEQLQVSAAQGEDVSIQIPETGMSLSQLEQWLKDRFGRERRMTGELAFAADGSLVLNTRVGGTALAEQRGSQAELPAMLQRAAEDLMGKEQPRTYSVFLSRSQRFEELKRFAEAQLLEGGPTERALAYYTLAGAPFAADEAERRRYLELSIATDPKAHSAAMNNLAGLEANAGRQETAFRRVKRLMDLYADRTAFTDLSPQARAQLMLSNGSRLDAFLHDHNAALAKMRELSRQTLLGFASGYAPELEAVAQLAALHDIGAARQALADFRPRNEQQAQNAQRGFPVGIAIQAQEWPLAQALSEANQQQAANPQQVRGNPLILLRLGRIAEAEALIAPMPLDCLGCVILRGELAEAKGERRLADHWLSQALLMAPSLPDPAHRYGEVLLARGDNAAAIAQFRTANARGPRWADPLEGWGEALLASGDAKGAIDKFRAAEELAPMWGRLHLKWGEALAKAGKAKEARERWAAAAKLYLTPAERAELVRLQGAR